MRFVSFNRIRLVSRIYLISAEYSSLHTAKKFFLGFGISITFKNVFKPKKVHSDALCHQIKLYISQFGHDQ